MNIKKHVNTVSFEDAGGNHLYLKVGDLGAGKFVCFCDSDTNRIDDSEAPYFSVDSEAEADLIASTIKELLKN